MLGEPEAARILSCSPRIGAGGRLGEECGLLQLIGFGIVVRRSRIGDRGNGLEYGGAIGEHLGIGEAQNLITVGFNHLGARLVIVFTGFVDGAIEFDREFDGGAIEVEDKAPDRVLAAKAESVYLFAFQGFPEVAFGGGHLLPEGEGGGLDFGGDATDAVVGFAGAHGLLGRRFGVRVPKFWPSRPPAPNSGGA